MFHFLTVALKMPLKPDELSDFYVQRKGQSLCGLCESALQTAVERTFEITGKRTKQMTF